MTIYEIMKSKNVGRKKYAMVNKIGLVSLMIETVVKDKKESPWKNQANTSKMKPLVNNDVRNPQKELKCRPKRKKSQLMADSA